VEYNLNEDGTGVIHKILPRKNYISRKAPKIKGASYRGERLEQVGIANIDQMFIVSSFVNPLFNNKVIDRFLVTAESSGCEVIIILNKIDLDSDNDIEPWLNLYSDIGYKVIPVSAKTAFNIEKIKELLPGKKSFFWGQSGVGKSSILNSIFPGLNLATNTISASTSKGKHTTVTTLMVKVEKDTFVVDTPGIREIDPYGIRKEDLGHYFKEFKEYINECKFNTCTHKHEPGCAVIEAVEEGRISEVRYDSYLRMLETVEEDILF
jgi:ribosome biogenesis GTPase